MRRRIPLLIAGGLLGLVLAGATALALESWRRPQAPPPARLLSDCDGALAEIVLHHRADTAAITGRIYRAFLADLPPTVTVAVVCPTRPDFEDLVARVEPVRCQLRPVVVDHAITCWSRDRWLALAAGSLTTLLLPAREDAAGRWPMRAGDARVGGDLATTLAGVAAERSRWDFDGGDVVADEHCAFVAPAVIRKNLGHRGDTAAELAARLGVRLGRRVVFLEGAPDHHAGMVLMPVGGKRVLVGDPALAAALPAPPGGWTPVGDDFSPATQASFDAVAERCRAAGYAVTRIPVVPGRNGRTWLSYVNGLIDERDGVRTVYLPAFAHAPALDALARRTWEGLGYRVVPVDCTDAYVHFGTLRCLVNVVRRG